MDEMEKTDGLDVFSIYGAHHQDDVAPALLLQLLDISSILANQLACG